MTIMPTRHLIRITFACCDITARSRSPSFTESLAAHVRCEAKPLLDGETQNLAMLIWQHARHEHTCSRKCHERGRLCQRYASTTFNCITRLQGPWRG